MLQKSTIQIIAYLVVVGSVLLNACSPLARTIVSSSGSQPTPEIQIESPQAGSEQTPLPGTADSKSIDVLLDLLKTAGVPVESVEKVDSSLLDSSNSFTLKVAGSEMFIYDFSSAEAALAASQRIGPDGTEITGLDGSISSVRWIAPPHFWLHKTFIIQYLGEDEAMLASLEQAFGKSFAGMRQSGDDASFERLWKEIRVEQDGFGFAVPCWWQVGEMPTEGIIRSLSMRNYDDAFFKANSEKGEWKDGITPEGAVKMDITIVELNDSSISNEEAFESLVDSSMTAIEASKEVTVGRNQWNEFTLRNLVNTQDAPDTVFVGRLAPNKLVIVSALPWPAGMDSSDVQAVLSSFAFSSERAIQLPTIEPQTPLIEASCAM